MKKIDTLILGAGLTGGCRPPPNLCIPHGVEKVNTFFEKNRKNF